MKRPIKIAVLLIGVIAHSLGCAAGTSETGSGGPGGAPGTTSSSTTSAGGTSCVPVDDSNPCTEDVCLDGVPSNPDRANDSACDDGNACTQSDTCQAGVCVGDNPVVCGVGTSCVAGACVACTGTAGVPGVPSPQVGSYPASVLALDLNGDGKTDLAVANMASQTVTVWLGNGDGTFASRVNYLTGRNAIHITGADHDDQGGG